MVFDIETGAYPLPELLRIDPFVPGDVKLPPHPGVFSEAAVKLGNTKDPVKVAEKIKSSKEKHEADVASHESKCKQAIVDAETAHTQSLLEGAALRADLSRVLAIGYLKSPESIHVDGRDDEAEMIRQFWARSEKVQLAGGRMVGFNTHFFDLPYLVRRSWILEVPVPAWVMHDARYWHACFVDAARVWACCRFNEFISLARACRAIGLPGKTESGADFAAKWKNDRDAAIAYLKGDLLDTHRFAARIGITH